MEELSFPGDDAGQILKYAVFFSTSDPFPTPKLSEFILFYRGGYPDRPQIDVGDDNIWDWRSILFLNESAVQVSDESEVGEGAFLSKPSTISYQRTEKGL